MPSPGAPPPRARFADDSLCWPLLRLRSQLSLFPKQKNEQTGEMESTFETIEEWVPPPPEEAWESEREREIEEAEQDDD